MVAKIVYEDDNIINGLIIEIKPIHFNNDYALFSRLSDELRKFMESQGSRFIRLDKSVWYGKRHYWEKEKNYVLYEMLFSY